MKQLLIPTVLLVGLLSLVSCGQNQKTEVVPMPNDSQSQGIEEAKGDLDDGAVESAPEFSESQFAEVYQNYNELKSALVNSKADQAGKAGQELVKSLEKVGADMETIAAAKIIAEHEDINEKRTAFRELSTAVVELLDGKVTSGDVFLQHCPMAFNGQGGSWLSASGEIRNPYLPESMLNCGSVRDTLQ